MASFLRHFFSEISFTEGLFFFLFPFLFLCVCLCAHVGLGIKPRALCKARALALSHTPTLFLFPKALTASASHFQSPSFPSVTRQAHLMLTSSLFLPSVYNCGILILLSAPILGDFTISLYILQAVFHNVTKQQANSAFHSTSRFLLNVSPAAFMHIVCKC